MSGHRNSLLVAALVVVALSTAAVIVVRGFIEDMLRHDATAAAQTWAESLVANVEDLPRILSGAMPSDNSILFFNQAKILGGVWRFKIYKLDGRLAVLSSAIGKTHRFDVSLADQEPVAFATLSAGEAVVDTRDGAARGEPDFLAEATIPIVVRDEAIGYLGVIVDESARKAFYLDKVARLAAQIALVVVIAFAIPGGGYILRTREKEAANRKLREEECRAIRQSRRFEVALDNMQQGLCMFDADNRLIVCNRRLAEIYGLPDELTATGASFADINKAAFGMDAQIYMLESLRVPGDEETVERSVELAGGRTVRIVRRAMPNGGWVATHEDITSSREAEQQIAYLAHHDTLTGLLNRTSFKMAAEKALARVERGERLATLFLDLDHFKAVNDTLGHAVGDILLKSVAARLLECVRSTDTIGRLGGDEFAIIQVDASPEEATLLAARIVERLSQSFVINGHQIVIGVSVGISIAPGDSANADELLKQADLALYRAKIDGRGTSRFFERSMDADLQARRLLEIGLRAALVDNQFQLYYQPLVNLATDSVCGFEALLRWNHPERGMVSPDEFIPLAEECGIIVPIGAWVLRQACAEAAKWPGEMKISVNISSAQFKSKSLVDDVLHALLLSGLPASRLDLEITESVMLSDTSRTLCILHELRDLGVTISMDDFGTGYSSLSYLQKFPFDKIKIDQSFIREMKDSDRSHAIVRAVTGIGASFGMTTTAEGVETEAQLRMARREGVTEVQGYYFSRPVPAGEVRDVLADVALRCRSDRFQGLAGPAA